MLSRTYRSRDGQWRTIVWAYMAYVSCFLLGSSIHKPVVNIIGAGVMTSLLLMVWVRRPVAARGWILVPLGVTAVTVAASALSDQGEAAAGAILKLLATLFLIFIGLAWKLRPLGETRMRRWLIVLVMTVLAISVVMPMDEVGDGRLVGRVAGVFVNPNNLALTAMLLLLCLDEARDRPAFFWGARLLVLAVILATGTSGALLAYGAETVLRLARKRKGWIVGVPLAVTAIIGIVLVAFDGNALPEIPIPQVQRLQKQLSVIAASQDALLRGSEIDFYAFERDMGAGVTSGLWRFFHWRILLSKYADGSAWELLFGKGIESVRACHPLPHNEYVRVLYELGIVGLLSWLAVWIALFRRAAPAHRGAFVMVAVYSFSENNLDNFLFMSLFALFAASAGGPKRSLTRDGTLLTRDPETPGETALRE